MEDYEILNYLNINADIILRLRLIKYLISKKKV